MKIKTPANFSKSPIITNIPWEKISAIVSMSLTERVTNIPMGF